MFWINGGLSEEEMYRYIENSLSRIDYFIRRSNDKLKSSCI
jgi:hypothetical protein